MHLLLLLVVVLVFVHVLLVLVLSPGGLGVPSDEDLVRRVTLQIDVLQGREHLLVGAGGDGGRLAQAPPLRMGWMWDQI